MSLNPSNEHVVASTTHRYSPSTRNSPTYLETPSPWTRPECCQKSWIIAAKRTRIPRVLLISLPACLDLLRCAISVGATNCVSALPELISPSDLANLPFGSTIIHQCVWRLADNSERGQIEPDMVHAFVDALLPQHPTCFALKDVYGKTPLHYAAEYGLTETATYLALKMASRPKFEPARYLDLDSVSPLHLSIMNGHLETTRCLLGQADLLQALSSSLPLIICATWLNNPTMIELLLAAGLDINEANDNGETALHIASRLGYDACVDALLNPKYLPNVDLSDNLRKWTPIFGACSNGHGEIVSRLAGAGANTTNVDTLGWSAQEYAALHGHLATANLLVANLEPQESATAAQLMPDYTTNHTLRLAPIDRRLFQGQNEAGKSMIVLQLGSMDTKSCIAPLQLESMASSTSESSLSIDDMVVKVSPLQALGQPTTIDLSNQGKLANQETVVFFARDVSKSKIVFELSIKDYDDHRILGRGIALLASIKQTVGTGMQNINNVVTVPILSIRTLELVATLVFNFVVVRPFRHQHTALVKDQSQWKSPVVIGHRGLGRNLEANKFLQIGENSILAHQAGASLGAAYVEFEVQMTKDLCPVIYHDFNLSETGIDSPVHTITKKQFLQLGNTQVPLVLQQSPTSGSRPRSLSTSNGYPLSLQADMHERIKLTSPLEHGGWKANAYGNVIKDQFATLEQTFGQVPPEVAFDIEFKYPMLQEAETLGMHTYAVELDTFVNVILDKIYEFAEQKRSIIFSSFHPEICIMLAYKQCNYPVLFLTDAGLCSMGDYRAESLHEAIEFATKWQLQGVICATASFEVCPRLIRRVKNVGLICASYGLSNNNPDFVKIQLQQGIDAVIVDQVVAYRHGVSYPPQL